MEILASEVRAVLTAIGASEFDLGSTGSRRRCYVLDKAGAVLLVLQCIPNKDLRGAEAHDFLRRLHLNENEFRNVAFGLMSRDDYLDLVEPRIV
jgi:hypothetical protein